MTITDTINAQVKSIVEDVKALPETFKKIDVADLQKQAQGFAQTALGTLAAALLHGPALAALGTLGARGMCRA